MKRIVVLVLLVAMFAPMVFAEDAKVLPQGVGRFYVVPGYAWASKAYDSDGNREDIGNGIDSVSFANLALALEYGVLPWMSAGIKANPGWVYYSNFDGADDATANDFSDFELGFKTQIVGPEAPVVSDNIRFVITPGVFIPLAGPDWSEEATNLATGNEYNAQAASNHAMGFGAYAAVDYVVNDSFFISLFGEGRFYQPASFEDINLTTAATAATIDAGLATFTVPAGTTGNAAIDGQEVTGYTYDSPADNKTRYGYDLNIELSPHYETSISSGVRFSASLPVDFRYTPGLSLVDDYNGFNSDFSNAVISTGPAAGTPVSTLGGDALVQGLETGVDANSPTAVAGVDSALENTDSYSVTVTPGVSVFFTAIPLPIEVTLDWAVPLIGTNTTVLNSVSSQIRFYFAF